jgi:RNA polymerase sigma-70 factor, ECF subfamily
MLAGGDPLSVTERTPSPQSPNVSAPAGDAAAAEPRERPTFDAIYESDFSFVCKSLRRLGAAPSDVGDLAQEVFLVVLRRLCDFDPSRPLRPWLFGIAYRVFIDDLRLARRKREVLETREPDADSGHGDHAAGDGAEGERRALVLAALLALDIEQRAVLVLHDIEEFTMPEIADALAVPLNTGYSRLRLARERFSREVRRLRKKRGEVDG